MVDTICAIRRLKPSITAQVVRTCRLRKTVRSLWALLQRSLPLNKMRLQLPPSRLNCKHWLLAATLFAEAKLNCLLLPGGGVPFPPSPSMTVGDCWQVEF